MNNALNFDGKKNYVEVPLPCPANDGGAITVEFWNYSDTNPGSFAFSFGDGKGLTSERVSCHAPWEDGQIYWDCGDSVNGRLKAPYSDYLKKWVHIALVSGGASNPGYQAIYINGKLIADQKTSKKSNRPFSTLLIGATEWADKQNVRKDWFHKGKIDQFRVWNRVRAQEEIMRDMNAELIGDEPGLVACFNFNWGIPGRKAGGDLWNKLRNSVPGAADGELRGFAGTEYTESDVPTKAPVGPIFRLTKGGAEYYTASYAEKKKMIELKWVEDAAPAFYAHRAPAPGTIPLCRFRNTKNEAYRLTASRVDRMTLDPRTNKNQPVGDWCYDGEICYVSATQNGKAAPYPSDTTQPTLCYVLPSIDSNYEPKPIVFANGVSEHLWYAIVCRSENEKWGLKLEDEGKDTKPRLELIPEIGDYAKFQWRIMGNKIINRAFPNSTLDLRSNWVPVANKGTDCFSLLQGDKPLLEKAEWTLLATELREGYTIPYPPATHCGLPFSKYLPATDGKATVHVLGTGTVSDWAMLRSKLIIENMMRALKPEVVDTQPLDGVEVIVISKDDSSEELANAPCLGCIYDAKSIERTRGFAVDFMCCVTEEAMWTDRVFSGTPEKIHHRQFDQLIHEFGHVMHRATTIDENQTPIGLLTPDGPDKLAAEDAKNTQRTTKKSELYVMSVQSWFNNITTVGGQYYPETREKLKRVDSDRYNFIATHFNAANTWMPPIEFRKEPSHTVDDDKSGDTAPDDYESGDTAPEGISV